MRWSGLQLATSYWIYLSLYGIYTLRNARAQLPSGALTIEAIEMQTRALSSFPISRRSASNPFEPAQIHRFDFFFLYLFLNDPLRHVTSLPIYVHQSANIHAVWNDKKTGGIESVPVGVARDTRDLLNYVTAANRVFSLFKLCGRSISTSYNNVFKIFFSLTLGRAGLRNETRFQSIEF